MIFSLGARSNAATNKNVNKQATPGAVVFVVSLNVHPDWLKWVDLGGTEMHWLSFLAYHGALSNGSPSPKMIVFLPGTSILTLMNEGIHMAMDLPLSAWLIDKHLSDSKQSKQFSPNTWGLMQNTSSILMFQELPNQSPTVL